MRYTCSYQSLSDLKAECLILPVTKFDRISGSALRMINETTSGAVQTLLDSGEFNGSALQTAVLYNPNGLRASRVILLGLGERRGMNAERMRRGMGVVSRLKSLQHVKAAALLLSGITKPDLIQAAAEGYLLGSFVAPEYKTRNKPGAENILEEICFVTADRKAVRKAEAAIKRGTIIAEGQILARRLALAPPDELTPANYANRIVKLAKKHGLKCTVLDKAAITKQKMGALLGVAKGSVEPPRFVILEHRGRAGRKPIVLVGKGVTFDTGGISLKQALNMHEMKQDMAGSAAVVGALVTAARLNFKLNIVGLMPITENMPSGSAFKPGDILTSRKGLTIEITNTDAEGRLILADALDYAGKFDPAAVVDVATLTGATKFILGYEGAPVVGTNPGLVSQLKKASAVCGERIWELPLYDEYSEMMISPIADLHNSDGSRSAGTLTAAAFLNNFTGDYPWAHLDIAYMDLEPKGRPYIPKGASGFGVRLLTEFLSAFKAPKS